MYKFNWAKDFVTNKKVVSKFTLHSPHKNVVSKEEFSKLLWAKDFVTIQRGHQLGKHFLHSAHKNVVNKEEFGKLLWAKDYTVATFLIYCSFIAL